MRFYQSPCLKVALVVWLAVAGSQMGCAASAHAGENITTGTLFQDKNNNSVSVDDLRYYFSPIAPGQSAEKMSSPPNIELAIEHLYLAKVISSEFHHASAPDSEAREWLAEFLVDRNVMQLALAVEVQGALADTDWVAQAREYYIANAEEFQTTPQVRASHILIYSEGGRLFDAMVRAEGVRNRLLAGEHFADVAAEVSDDRGGQSGGDLGYFGRGRMVKPFEDVAFSLHEGQISDLVVTEYGVHIIKLTGVKESEKLPFESVRDEIVAKLKPKFYREARELILEQRRAAMKDGGNFIDTALIEQLREGAPRPEQ